MLLVIINYCFVSRIPCSFLFLLVPLFPFCFPCSASFSLFPRILLFPLFPLVPLFPLFPLFLLFPPFSPCSPLFPYSLLFPLSPFVSLVAPCAPCSPVSLVRLQFTTLNVLQPQISVNEKIACENIRFSSLFASGKERGERDVFAGYEKHRSPFKRNPLKSRILSHKHVTEKVLHLNW